MATDHPNSLLANLPHEGAMLLIDSVLHVDAQSARTLTYFDERRATLRPVDHACGNYFGIELIAQAAALPLIFSAQAGEVHQGMIVQVKSFHAYGPQLEGVLALETHCEVELVLDGKLASVSGRVFYQGEVCCEAILTLALEVVTDG